LAKAGQAIRLWDETRERLIKRATSIPETRRAASHPTIMAPFLRMLVPLVLVGAASAAGTTVHLSEQTRQAFDSYVETAESAMRWRPSLTSRKSAEIQVAPCGGATPAPVVDGLIHDWIASIEIPAATVDQALRMFQRYEDYPSMFPGVVDSRVLSRLGNQWRVHLRLRRKNVLTVVLDSDYQIEYRPLEDGKWAIVSRSGPISEIENGSALAPDNGNGFLWRLNAYWLLAPRPGGLYLECRAISLSRDIPTGLNWLIKPMISGVPRDSLRQTVDAARRALRQLTHAPG
jgi:hypothetical protein